MADVDKIIADQIEAAKRAGKEYQGRPSEDPKSPEPAKPAPLSAKEAEDED